MSGPSSEQQEVDVWWGGYSVQALVPVLALGVALSAMSVGVACFLYLVVGVQGSLPRWLIYDFNVVMWSLELGHAVYRLAGFQYRLTTKRLFVLWGFLFTPPPPIELGQVRTVEVMQAGWQHWLRVGSVVVGANDRAPLVLTGVRHPEVIATEIESCVRHRRGGTTHSGIAPAALVSPQPHG